MKSPEELRQQVQQQQQQLDRLQRATTRLEAAQQERIWAIASVHRAGLSIRQIAAATRLSPTRIHQLLQDPEAQNIPAWLSQLEETTPKAQDVTGDSKTTLCDQLVAEVEVLRWCIGWLEKLQRGERVVVNLRPDSDPQTEFVQFDHAQVLRVLSRVTNDLDHLTRQSSILVEQPDKVLEHRQRLAIPEPSPKRLTQREQRAALRSLFSPPSVQEGK